MVPPPKYTDEQREAAAIAFVERDLSGTKVSALAASGDLKAPNGDKLGPFDMPPASVRYYGGRFRRRRQGRIDNTLVNQSPRDAVEEVRRRLLNMLGEELSVLERQKPGTRDPDLIRQLGRAGREVAALPGPNDPRPTAPGSKQGGTVNGAKTTRGTTTLAGAILGDTGTDGAARGEPLQTEGTAIGDSGQAVRQQDNAQWEGDAEPQPGSLTLALAQGGAAGGAAGAAPLRGRIPGRIGAGSHGLEP